MATNRKKISELLKRAKQYLSFKEKMNRLAEELTAHIAYLKEHLTSAPDEKVLIDGRVVYLQHRDTKSLNWDLIKSDAGPLLAELAPFVKKEEYLDFKAAERMIDMSRPDVQKYLVTKTTIALCDKAE